MEVRVGDFGRVDYAHANEIVGAIRGTVVAAETSVSSGGVIQATTATIPTVTTEHTSFTVLNTSTLSTGTLTSIELKVEDDIKVNGTLSIPTLTVPNVTVSSATVNTANGDNMTTNTMEATTGTSDTTSADTINTGVFNATGNIQSSSLTYNELDVDPYNIPEETVFRGAVFFNNLDVGIDPDPNTKISMHLEASSGLAYIEGFNRFLGAIDSGTDYGGVKAIFSMSSNTAPYRTLRFQTDGNLAIYSDTVTVLWESATQVSDARLKKNVEPIVGALDKVLKLRGVFYEYKESIAAGRFVGVIAQEVEDIFPYCVKTAGEYKLVRLERLVPLLIEAFRELEERASLIRSLERLK